MLVNNKEFSVWSCLLNATANFIIRETALSWCDLWAFLICYYIYFRVGNLVRLEWGLFKDCSKNRRHKKTQISPSHVIDVIFDDKLQQEHCGETISHWKVSVRYDVKTGWQNMCTCIRITIKSALLEDVRSATINGIMYCVS